jgi:crotonobetainyl-CoA:carnitine CoA-transferase CaiB-like acyl-CoA transferase
MALLDTQVAVLANQALNWMASGEVPRRMGNGHINLVPYQAFEVADGEMIVAVGNDRQFERLCSILGLEPLAADERFRTNPARVVNRAELIPLLREAMLKRRSGELAEALEAVGIPAGPINEMDSVFADPQVVNRGLRIELGGLPGLASPIVIDGRRQVAENPSPKLGSASKLGSAP